MVNKAPLQKGSVYSATRAQLSLWTSYSSAKLPDGEYKFLKGLFEAFFQVNAETWSEDSDSEDVIQIYTGQLQEKLKSLKVGSSKTTIHGRNNSFVDKGFFYREETTETVRGRGRKPRAQVVHVFRLAPLSDFLLAASNAEKQTVTDTLSASSSNLGIKEGREAILDHIRSVDGLRLSPETKGVALCEQLWNCFLGSAMRTSHLDVRKKGPFETTLYFGKTPIKCVTASMSDTDSAHYGDQRTMRTMITMIVNRINYLRDNYLPIKNEFYVSVLDILKLQGMKDTGANRITIRESLQRIAGTKFRLDLSNREASQAFREAFKISELLDEVNFQFFATLDESLQDGSEPGKAKWYRCVLDARTYENILNDDLKNTFVDKEDILHESSGIIHIFHAWCSSWAKNKVETWYHADLNILHAYIFNAFEIGVFQRRFIHALKKYTDESGQGKCWADGGEVSFKFLGFLIRLTPSKTSGYEVFVKLDKEDKILGTGSMRMKRRLTKAVSVKALGVSGGDSQRKGGS